MYVDDYFTGANSKEEDYGDNCKTSSHVKASSFGNGTQATTRYFIISSLVLKWPNQHNRSHDYKTLGIQSKDHYYLTVSRLPTNTTDARSRSLYQDSWYRMECSNGPLPPDGIKAANQHHRFQAQNHFTKTLGMLKWTATATVSKLPTNTTDARPRSLHRESWYPVEC